MILVYYNSRGNYNVINAIGNGSTYIGDTNKKLSDSVWGTKKECDGGYYGANWKGGNALYDSVLFGWKGT